MQKETLLTSSFLFILSIKPYTGKGMQFYLVLAEVPGVARGI